MDLDEATGRSPAGALRATVDSTGVFEIVPEVAERRESESAVLPLGVAPEQAAMGQRRYEVITDGWRFEVVVEDARLARLRESATRRAGASTAGTGPTPVRAVIPGRVVSVVVAVGDHVGVGDRLLSIEAMKMENEVRAIRAGTIEQVTVQAGDRVELGDQLVVIG